ncbi:2,3-diaminopropionate biosynthesis protein SbnB [Streptomyces phaeolivaceus]|uniref:2,3-diaminopropionate biosynthesis protein SbnB n=1 Tax=Streptomyces phaeolivaceus TaxID=2653200 RepID=A0A5P8K8H0_9ACTN|nr:2,3-diaminopropionate biosynthesis protein SbnB [Streptomyces phaeolivaceus]QFQ99401.1 2,3-diaminopropionate biosynthesis protein SbnB [Streptomyces phaeolivaceus]
MLILRRSDVTSILDRSHEDVIRTVRDAYVAHARKQTSVPQSVFLRFPDDARNRIIALPAYVGGERPVAGVKWIASFPGNVARGAERASAAILLNSMTDGQPVALVEGSVISARRTAAGAALAAATLTEAAGSAARTGVSLIGCGVINHEVLSFLRVQLPELNRVTLFDLDAERTRAFGATVRATWPGLTVETADSIDAAFAAHRIVSLATTASTPHITTDACRPGTVVLHLSLRDLTPASLLTATNVVDDADHVCRASTSLDLAEQMVGDRQFIAAEIGDVLAGAATAPHDPDGVTVFSPFGLGALDAALAAHVVDTAEALGMGIELRDFTTDRSGTGA